MPASFIGHESAFEGKGVPAPAPPAPIVRCGQSPPRWRVVEAGLRRAPDGPEILLADHLCKRVGGEAKAAAGFRPNFLERCVLAVPRCMRSRLGTQAYRSPAPVRSGVATRRPGADQGTQCPSLAEGRLSPVESRCRRGPRIYHRTALRRRFLGRSLAASAAPAARFLPAASASCGRAANAVRRLVPGDPGGRWRVSGGSGGSARAVRRSRYARSGGGCFSSQRCARVVALRAQGCHGGKFRPARIEELSTSTNHGSRQQRQSGKAKAVRLRHRSPGSS